MSQPVRRAAALVPTRRRGARSPHWMLDQLPLGMVEDDFFVRFVGIFQELGASLLDDADNIDHILDVTVAPPVMVRWLASWIGSGAIDSSLPDELQRRVVASAAETLTWRGTRRGLARYLELASGGSVTVEDGGGVWVDGDAPSDTAWVAMSVESTGWMPEADFINLVRDEVPAHVRAELWIAGPVRLALRRDDGAGSASSEEGQ